jgi:hypothetical protein
MESNFLDVHNVEMLWEEDGSAIPHQLTVFMFGLLCILQECRFKVKHNNKL